MGAASGSTVSPSSRPPYPALRRRLWLVRGRLAVRAAVRAAKLGRTPGERWLAAFLAAAGIALLGLAVAAVLGVPPVVGVPAVFAAVAALVVIAAVLLGGPPDAALAAEREQLAAALPEAKRLRDEERLRRWAEREVRQPVEPVRPVELQPAPVVPLDAEPVQLVAVPIVPAADWLQGDGTFPLTVAGESYHQRALEEICGGRGEDRVVPAVLRLEDSPYDRYAVAVLIGGRKVGHLARPDARAFRLRVAGEGRVGPEFPVRAVIDYRGQYAVRLDVRLY